jgi:hypothetical protein
VPKILKQRHIINLYSIGAQFFCTVNWHHKLICAGRLHAHVCISSPWLQIREQYWNIFMLYQRLLEQFDSHSWKSDNQLPRSVIGTVTYTGCFISPSGMSDLCGTVAGMVTPKGSMSTEGETLQVFVLPNVYRCSIAPFCCNCLGCCAADFGSSEGAYELPCNSIND